MFSLTNFSTIIKLNCGDFSGGMGGGGWGGGGGGGSTPRGPKWSPLCIILRYPYMAGRFLPSPTVKFLQKIILFILFDSYEN